MDSLLGEAAEGAAAEWGAGFAIYRRGVAAHAAGALAAAYPVVRRLVGEAFFAEAVRRYARAHPSSSGDLHEFGAAFGAFLARYAPARPVPILPDMARLEWALHECRLAGDGVGADFAALGTLGPAEHAYVRLAMHPAARLLSSAHPILAVWEANQAGRDGRPEPLPGPDHVLVHRAGLEPRAARLAPAEWTIAKAIASGAALGEVVDGLDPDEARGFADALVRLAALGAFDGFVARPP